jgi:hypothetical protein
MVLINKASPFTMHLFRGAVTGQVTRDAMVTNKTRQGMTSISFFLQRIGMKESLTISKDLNI